MLYINCRSLSMVLFEYMRHIQQTCTLIRNNRTFLLQYLNYKKTVVLHNKGEHGPIRKLQY